MPRRQPPQTPHLASLTIDDILPHLRITLFFTGAFVVAWSWDLVVYGASHAWAVENPVLDQLSFGDAKSPKQLGVLLLQYLLVCGAAAVFSDYLRRKEAPWSQAAVTAVEFFPSPIFAGKLMAYLGQFSSSLGLIDKAIINLAATWFAASLAHATPILLSHLEEGHPRIGVLFGEEGRMRRLGDIVRDTLGFGLGIAWNVFLLQCFAPPDYDSKSSSSYNNLEIVHLIGLAGYLAVVTMIAFRLAAVVQESPDPTISDRQLALLSFASYVVCAFTLVTFLNAILHPGWLGELESLAVLLMLSAAMSAMVSGVDFDRGNNNSSIQTSDDDEEMEEGWKGLHRQPCWKIFCLILLFIPCVWWCCTWVPVMYLLAGTTGGTLRVKEHWHHLISMVSGLAASIQASGLLTETTDTVAAFLNICDTSHCHHRWLFVSLQACLAVLTTVMIIPAIATLTETRNPAMAVDEETARGEGQPLLRSLKKKISRVLRSKKSSNVSGTSS